jgi:hypothetical protein
MPKDSVVPLLAPIQTCEDLIQLLRPPIQAFIESTGSTQAMIQKSKDSIQSLLNLLREPEDSIELQETSVQSSEA